MRVNKFNGIPKHTFELHLKECEFRFNYRPQEKLYQKLLEIIRKQPLFSVERLELVEKRKRSLGDRIARNIKL